jgi:hypothetical protein
MDFTKILGYQLNVCCSEILVEVNSIVPGDERYNRPMSQEIAEQTGFYLQKDCAPCATSCEPVLLGNHQEPLSRSARSRRLAKST